MSFIVKKLLNNKINGKTIQAFTLAEILITLGIIGVVAAMTIPTLIKNYQKKQTVVQYKKTYSEIAQALKMAEVDNGSIETWDFTTSSTKTLDFATQYLYPYLKIEQKCDFSEAGCWTGPVSLTNTTGALPINATRLSAITASGYSILFWVSATGNSGFIYLDIDGPFKGRGKIGIDVFPIAIYFTSSGYKAEVAPYGLSHSPIPKTRNELITTIPDGCQKASVSTSAGLYCGGLIAIDGWEIADDYPWD